MTELEECMAATGWKRRRGGRLSRVSDFRRRAHTSRARGRRSTAQTPAGMRSVGVGTVDPTRWPPSQLMMTLTCYYPI
jgi:hypothetical protein